MLNSVMLALSVSIDALGIGITYGIKKAKINFTSKCILFIMSISFASISLFIGNFISNFLSEIITNIISSLILIFIGIIVLVEPIPFDFDNSCQIDIKETLILGIALSLDSICVGIGSSIGGFSNFCFPIFVSIFQLVFILLGIKFGNRIVKNVKISDKIWNIISGVILIIFGIIKLFIS